MAKKSAGILAYRLVNGTLEVLLVHPGGPFFIKKDLGVWSVPKGEYEHPDDPLQAAIREFEEETGNALTADKFIELTPVKLKSGKVISAWAVETDFDQCFIRSNEFELEWPPRSGKKIMVPEVDKAEWFTAEEAKTKVNPAQTALIEELLSIVFG